jgi:hypothetical protein
MSFDLFQSVRVRSFVFNLFIVIVHTNCYYK